MATLDNLVAMLGEVANANDLPQSLLDQQLRRFRDEDGQRRGWSRDRIGVSMGLTDRGVRMNRQKYAVQEVEKKITDRLKTANGCDLLDRALESTRPGHPVSEAALMGKLCLCSKDLAVILREGIKGGYLKKVGCRADSPDRTQQYEATGKQYIYPRAQTHEERRDRSLRASRVVRNVQPDAVWSVRRTLTKEGLERLAQFLDPQSQEATTLEHIQIRESESLARSKAGKAEANFGVLIAVAPAAPPDSGPRDHLYRALVDNMNPACVLLPTTGVLDHQAQEDFATADCDAIRKQILAVLDEAAALGEGSAEEYAILLAHAPLIESTHPDKAILNGAMTGTNGKTNGNGRTTTMNGKRNGKKVMEALALLLAGLLFLTAAHRNRLAADDGHSRSWSVPRDGHGRSWSVSLKGHGILVPGADDDRSWSVSLKGHGILVPGMDDGPIWSVPLKGHGILVPGMDDGPIWSVPLKGHGRSWSVSRDGHGGT
jgi:hypothetical protein